MSKRATETLGKNWFGGPGHLSTTPGFFTGNLCDVYFSAGGVWDFSDLMVLDNNGNKPIFAIDMMLKELVPIEKILTCFLGATAVTVPAAIAELALDEDPDIFEGVDLVIT